MLEKTIQAPLTRIFDALGWDWDEFDPTKAKKTTLDMFLKKNDFFGTRGEFTTLSRISGIVLMELILWKGWCGWERVRTEVVRGPCPQSRGGFRIYDVQNCCEFCMVSLLGR